MFYSSLPLSSKLFKFTALSVALSLAGCGGGDGGGDTLPPANSGGVTQSNTGGDGSTGGSGEQTPVTELNITDITLTDTNGNITRIITSSGASAKVTVTADQS